MGKEYQSIDASIRRWLTGQHLFFVATAPRADDGLINCSPKGHDTLRVLDHRTLMYLDYAGSGVETIAHLKENGRIVIMLCAFQGPPKIFRFHGRGEVITPNQPEFAELFAQFDQDHAGVRSIIRVHVSRISGSCGYGVPLYDYVEQRPSTENYIAQTGAEAIRRAMRERNRESLDGLPALAAAEVVAPPVPTAKPAQAR
jgi:hypothetical protein